MVIFLEIVRRFCFSNINLVASRINHAAPPLSQCLEMQMYDCDKASVNPPVRIASEREPMENVTSYKYLESL